MESGGFPVAESGRLIMTGEWMTTWVWQHQGLEASHFGQNQTWRSDLVTETGTGLSGVKTQCLHGGCWASGRELARRPVSWWSRDTQLCLSAPCITRHKSTVRVFRQGW